MQRFTISLDDELARQFDELINARSYHNRSEAVRDLIRTQLGDLAAATGSQWCVAAVTYIYDAHEQRVAERVLGQQHEHHDLVISSLRIQLDHDHCVETVVLRGPTVAVQTCAQELVALRGVRHGNIHIVPLVGKGLPHRHPHGRAAHTHLAPVN